MLGEADPGVYLNDQVRKRYARQEAVDPAAELLHSFRLFAPWTGDFHLAVFEPYAFQTARGQQPRHLAQLPVQPLALFPEISLRVRLDEEWYISPGAHILPDSPQK